MALLYHPGDNVVLCPYSALNVALSGSALISLSSRRPLSRPKVLVRDARGRLRKSPVVGAEVGVGELFSAAGRAVGLGIAVLECRLRGLVRAFYILGDEDLLDLVRATTCG